MVLSSPKSEITQAVGRIQRQKHEVVPLVIDIVDKNSEDSKTAFQCFTRQYYKRFRFFKKCKYNVIKIKVNDTETSKTKYMLEEYQKGCLEAETIKEAKNRIIKEKKLVVRINLTKL